MSYNVLLSDAAKADLDAIFGYVRDTLLEPVAAQNLLRGLYKAIASLSEMPERHRIVSASKKIRRMTYHNYEIFYKVDTEVYIVHVSHGHRSWQNLF